MLESKDHYKITILVERQDLAFASRVRGKFRRMPNPLHQ